LFSVCYPVGSWFSKCVHAPKNGSGLVGVGRWYGSRHDTRMYHANAARRAIQSSKKEGEFFFGKREMTRLKKTKLTRVADRQAVRDNSSTLVALGLRLANRASAGHVRIS